MSNTDDLLAKKRDLERRKERLLGKLESARSAQEQIDSELREMGVNPNDLEDEIERLVEERNLRLNTLREQVLQAEDIINRIENRVNTL